LSEEKPDRLIYLDNIKLTMILLVIAVHAAVTYGPVGSWIFRDRSTQTTTSDIVLSLFPILMQAFFMGLLFLVAGYFVPGSFERKGAKRFSQERVKRLGLPALIYIFVVAPLIIYFLFIDYSFVEFYLNYLSNPGDYESGPLWFVIALLAFSLAYVVYRIIFSAFGLKSGNWKPPSNVHLFILALLTAGLSFLVRFWYPIGTDIWNMQLCFFPQYIVLFFLGIVAYRTNWFKEISTRAGRFWLLFALASIPLIFLPLLIFGGGIEGNFTLYTGGFYWQAALYAIWEQFYAISMCVGLIVLFRENWNSQGPKTKKLSQNAFAMYVFQTPFLVLFGVWLEPFQLNPLLKFLALTVLGIGAIYAFCEYILRRIPFMKEIF
jgi:glucans biosynthesis protein C